PGLEPLERESGLGMVLRPDLKLVQCTVVVGSEPLEEIVNEALALIGTVRKLVSVEMVQPSWNEDVAENVESSGQPLDKIIDDVIVRVSAIVEVRAERCLPFLSL